ncbi:hypothetical protein [Paraburkholderia sp. RL17-337-BIB-A]|uniref:hypothetical protein n=1 Tax=Paraburkholderia sp. RL17-337-BIB-A TaxID=3031636 RepID=UPI0038BD58F1
MFAALHLPRAEACLCRAVPVYAGGGAPTEARFSADECAELGHSIAGQRRNLHVPSSKIIGNSSKLPTSQSQSDPLTNRGTSTVSPVCAPPQRILMNGRRFATVPGGRDLMRMNPAPLGILFF